MIEVSGLDRVGLLFELTNTISKLNLNIVSAQVTTFGERAVDTFYVKDLTGDKILSPTRQATIRRNLIEAFAANRRQARGPRNRAATLRFRLLRLDFCGFSPDIGSGNEGEPFKMNDENGENPPQQDDAPRRGAGRFARARAAPEAPAELETLRAELAGVKDRLLRTLAEMENLRRRTEKEIADAKLYGVTSFARETLALADNLRRAIAAFPVKAKEELEPHVAALLEGVELTERDFALAPRPFRREEDG